MEESSTQTELTQILKINETVNQSKRSANRRPA
jgi:hypothetical protein